MRSPQLLQRPRSISQPTIGMFSLALIWWPHFGHLDRGFTTESPSGQRLMQTLRKEPKLAPIRNTNAAVNISIMPKLVEDDSCRYRDVDRLDARRDRKRNSFFRCRANFSRKSGALVPDGNSQSRRGVSAD